MIRETLELLRLVSTFFGSHGMGRKNLKCTIQAGPNAGGSFAIVLRVGEVALEKLVQVRRSLLKARQVKSTLLKA